METLVTPIPEQPGGAPPAPPPRVRFCEPATGVLSLLDIESPMAGRSLGDVFRLLFDIRVQVVRVHVDARGDGPGVRMDLAEFDGAGLRPERRHQIREQLTELLCREPGVAAGASYAGGSQASLGGRP